MFIIHTSNGKGIIEKPLPYCAASITNTKDGLKYKFSLKHRQNPRKYKQLWEAKFVQSAKLLIQKPKGFFFISLTIYNIQIFFIYIVAQITLSCFARSVKLFTLHPTLEGRILPQGNTGFWTHCTDLHPLFPRTPSQEYRSRIQES